MNFPLDRNWKVRSKIARVQLGDRNVFDDGKAVGRARYLDSNLWRVCEVEVGFIEVGHDRIGGGEGEKPALEDEEPM